MVTLVRHDSGGLPMVLEMRVRLQPPPSAAMGHGALSFHEMEAMTADGDDRVTVPPLSARLPEKDPATGMAGP
jgi:hypothetical protein